MTWNPQSGASSGISLQGGSATTVQNTIPVTTLQPTANPMTATWPSAPEKQQGFVESANTVADPYSLWGGRAGYDRLVSGFNTQKAGIGESANEAATASGIGLKNSILDFIDSLRSGQTTIDNRNINNEVAKQRGVAEINRSVGTGIRSGGVKLSNMNSVDSSASDAIARAYGEIGRRQMSDVGNQYEAERGNIGVAQTDLETQRAAGLRRFSSAEEAAINSIISDATDKLTALDTAMANASLPERIVLDREKQNIRASVTSILSAYTGDKGTANTINPMAEGDRMTEATKRFNAGQVPATQFNYTTDTPTSFMGSGPYASELPIFTYRSNKDR